MSKKIPINNKPNSFVWIRVQDDTSGVLKRGDKTLAVTDGKGNAYRANGGGYMNLDSKWSPENIYDPETYEYVRGLRGMDV